MNNFFGDIEVTKTQFYERKKGIKLNDVDCSEIVVSNKVKGNKEIVKYFTGYMGEFVSPLRLLLPQMSGWIKHFEKGRKNMNFKIEENWVSLKYNEIGIG